MTNIFDRPKPPDWKHATRRRISFHAGVPAALLVFFGMILLQLAFWGGVIYVALHFLFKWW